MSEDKGYLLLVEDDSTLQLLNAEFLKHSGYSVKQAYTLAEAWEIINNKPPRGIILDVQLPDGNGIEFMKELRKKSGVPVLILTSMASVDNVIDGLNAGSDYYVTKPYDRSVFMLSIEAMLRRAEVVPDVIEYGHFKLYPTSGIALLDGEDIVLTQKEFSVLQLLVQQLMSEGTYETLSAELLYEKVWMQNMVDNKKSLQQTVFRLREKLADSIYTVNNSRGRGYYLEIQ
jgi:DNA-binding response OmpR family regulator